MRCVERRKQARSAGAGLVEGSHRTGIALRDAEQFTGFFERRDLAQNQRMLDVEQTRKAAAVAGYAEMMCGQKPACRGLRRDSSRISRSVVSTKASASGSVRVTPPLEDGTSP